MDDTLFVGEATVNNLWAMKIILRFFELTSYLKVKISKSNLIWMKVEGYFLVTASMFLSYKTKIFPFKYLSLSVEVNPHRTVI